MDRRTLLRNLGALSALGVAGCTTEDRNETDPASDEPTASATPGGTATATETPAETDTPATPPGDSTASPTRSPTRTPIPDTLPDSQVVELSGPPCEALAGATFKSIEPQAGGPSPGDTPTQYRWTVSFSDGGYDYTHTDVVESGTYDCTVTADTAEMQAQASHGDVTYDASYDAETGVLSWDGVDYLPVESDG